MIEQLGMTAAKIGAWVWGLPILAIFLGCYLIVSAQTGFVQFRHLVFIFKNTFGKLSDKKDGVGMITPFAASMTALGQSIGASNIVGIPIAIAIGGPGALFWMWVTCLLGMGMRYGEIAIAIKYRKKNSEGEWVGGPQVYIKEGLNAGALAMVWAIAYILIAIVSIPAQTASVVATAGVIGVPNWVTTTIMFVTTALVIYGGVKRIARFAQVLVPFMGLFYFVSAWIIIFAHGNELSSSLIAVFKHAFSPVAASGGFVGAGIILAMQQGVARGIYSFGAGMGDFTVVHASAITDHPCRQAQWGVFEMIISFIICTTSGLLALTTGLWNIGENKASTISALAFTNLYPGNLGTILLSLSLFLFVYSTILAIIYYGQRQAEYLLGGKFTKLMGAIFLLCIPFGVVGSMGFFLNFVDIILAFVVMSNIICVTAMSKQIRALVKDFFSNPKFYP